SGTRVYVNQGQAGEIWPVATTLIPDWDPQRLSLHYIQTTYPSLSLGNAYEAIARTRMVKTELEIATMRRSLAATMSSIRSAARQVRDQVTERDLASTFEGACKANGAQRIPFTIIKSGPNSLWPWRVLASHYDRRNRSMADGELVIFDVGCEVDYYVSDVGRTFPVSGRFSHEQRTVLEMEVAVSDAIIREIRPGITLRQLQTIGEDHIPEAHKEFMQAGLFFGHHIGLSASEPELPDVPLQAGMIFTVEPWYYNHQSGISVFTEDVVLVTKNGVEVLTSDLPRGTAELERLVRP
ncbi:MAG: Xaa-Pro aminopeptidase, partial [Woeseiaceae bacterium]